MMGQRGKRKRSAKSPDSRRREIQRRVAEAGERCIPELLVDLTDDWVVVREAAAAGLGKLKAVAALGPLAERVREDTNVDVRRVAANSLGLIGDPGAVGALLDLAIERNRLGGVALENLARLSLSLGAWGRSRPWGELATPLRCGRC
jgi:HEAT repeat protein